MAQIKDILCHISVEIADRKRICHRHRRKHSIQSGEACLIVKDGSGYKRNYCLPYAIDLLKAARSRINEISNDLGLGKDGLPSGGNE